MCALLCCQTAFEVAFPCAESSPQAQVMQRNDDFHRFPFAHVRLGDSELDGPDLEAGAAGGCASLALPILLSRTGAQPDTYEPVKERATSCPDVSGHDVARSFTGSYASGCSAPVRERKMGRATVS